jgi:hypothetical protein
MKKLLFFIATSLLTITTLFIEIIYFLYPYRTTVVINASMRECCLCVLRSSFQDLSYMRYLKKANYPFR